MTSRVVSLKGRPIKRLLPDEVYVGTKCYRGGWSLPASKWANPYVAGQHGTLAEVIARYERVWLLASPAERLAIIATTRPRITRVWPKLYTAADRRHRRAARLGSRLLVPPGAVPRRRAAKAGRSPEANPSLCSV